MYTFVHLDIDSHQADTENVKPFQQKISLLTNQCIIKTKKKEFAMSHATQRFKFSFHSKLRGDPHDKDYDVTDVCGVTEWLMYSDSRL